MHRNSVHLSSDPCLPSLPTTSPRIPLSSPSPVSLNSPAASPLFASSHKKAPQGGRPLRRRGANTESTERSASPKPFHPNRHAINKSSLVKKTVKTPPITAIPANQWVCPRLRPQLPNAFAFPSPIKTRNPSATTTTIPASCRCSHTPRASPPARHNARAAGPRTAPGGPPRARWIPGCWPRCRRSSPG